MVMLHFKIKDNHKCSNMVANILPTDPHDPRGMGSIGEKLNFSKHDHVAYKTKGNH